MQHLSELFYIAIESLLITGFISMYFEPKPRFSQIADVVISFVLILALDTIVSTFDVSWIIVMVFLPLILTLILEIFFKGGLLEHLLIAAISFILLALIDVCVFTLMSKLLGVGYSRLVTESNLSRFLTVMITKVTYLGVVSIIISFKKKYALVLHKIELAMISLTLIISGILISIVRNMIYNTGRSYTSFLVILLCVLLLNIVQYYTLIYISRKNIIERDMSLMRKQLEMQEDSIRNLERKYDETAKIRHDMKNYISCAIGLAEHGENDELIRYLKNLSEDKIAGVASYVNTKRKVLGAVINSKIGMAEQKGFDIQCIILSELDNIGDIDAGILIANLLDNAIEACGKNIAASEIMLKIWSEAGYYCIEVSNTVEKNVLEDNPNLYTSKKNKSLHGVGLKSVRDIVKKYSGMISFNQKSNKFSAYVSLENASCAADMQLATH